MTYTYKTQGTCSKLITIDIDEDGQTIQNVSYTGGCNGNLKGIAALVKGMPSHVNVIPVNKIKERSFTSDRAAAHRFCGFLNELGVNATVRRTLGSDIDAACGQLRREYEI